jgi:excinuclease ABC subunit B
VQVEYNLEHGIVPKSITREIMDVMEGARSEPDGGKGRSRKVAEESAEYRVMEPAKLAARLKQLEAQMYQHARDLEFEQAGKLRDEMQRLKAASLQSPI